MNVFYVVGRISREMGVESNLPIKLPFVKLKWCEGQIGVLPVFEDRTAAAEVAKGAPIIEIHEIDTETMAGGDDGPQ